MATAIKNKNHTLVSITTLSDNSLQKLADYSLFCYSPAKFLKGYNITDKAPLLVTLNSLFEKYQQYV
ncbi:hypothetical protein [Jeotgalibaca sp. MA1X17-3]|uniref:hypothetical protein n=1 Tax=Jeotgalibaca sp. MA1X17-3 TaxID=2908211 RepID=UPI0037BFAB41